LEEAVVTRRNQILSALALITIGVIITVVSYSVAEGGGHYVVAWGVILVGAVRLERAFFKNNNPQQGGDSSRDPGEPPFTGPQLAGSECTHCHQRIISYLVGVQCKRCQLPLHRDCRKDHRAEAHARPASSVYR
jgi:hypothetical protein